MARTLIACLVALVLLPPAAAATSPLGIDRPAVHRPVLDVTGGGDARTFPIDNGTLLPTHACDGDQIVAACSSVAAFQHDIETSLGRPSGLADYTARSLGAVGTPYAFAKKTAHRVIQCNGEQALSPDAECARACDASKEVCDGKCTTGLNTCLTQCPGLGFACDAYCRAAVIVCRNNCVKARGACVDGCPQRGGQRESKRNGTNGVSAQ